VEFIKQFSNFNTYTHKKGIIINGILRRFPINREVINEMPERIQILRELDERPTEPDYSNFENYMISVLGKKLYELYIYNYTRKMWGKEPKELNARWVINRIGLKNDNSEVFDGEWQGLPKEGYTKLFEKMVEDIPIEYNCKNFDNNHDIVLFSGRLDELFQYKFGTLEYRSMEFETVLNEIWENEDYGTINMPQDPVFIRKANFNVLYQQDSQYSIIQYQKAVPTDDSNRPMYPINTRENSDLALKYIKEACMSNKIIPVGRLGLYKYLDMDKAISMSMELIPLIELWGNLKPKERFSNLCVILNKY
jgi:UDP-galactopyranose mutase